MLAALDRTRAGSSPKWTGLRTTLGEEPTSHMGRSINVQRERSGPYQEAGFSSRAMVLQHLLEPMSVVGVDLG